ncbi:anthranilate phosphoribosyltransferase, partial [Candidatus Gottesmanbacteria bacterium]|nr:anthranilate phosphoribosyltransferase [Candidatus Gottesmanbacteria bacterium]
GETIDEILGFITVMRKHMVKIKTSGLVIDTCGTGGDGKGTFNISTATAFVVAGTGIKVAKHGNRNASSLCGSADVLEALRVNINLSPKQAETMLSKTNFTFLFAPLFHPAMKYVAQVRKELKIRTVFNFLGPFVSPAQVKRQIIGVPSIKLAEKLAKVATNLDYEHLLVVSSEDGLDEISLSAPTQVFEVRGKKVKKIIIHPKELGFRKTDINKIKGADAKTNAEIIKNILGGRDGVKRDIVLLNSAAALLVSGKAANLKEGLSLAKKSIESGKAKEVLGKVVNYENHIG